MKKIVELPKNQSIEIEYDETVYSPAHSSVDAIVLADVALEAHRVVSKVMKNKKEAKLLDLACGSGVMALALKQLNPSVDVSACDISEEAINITLKNMLAQDTFIKIFKSDLLKKADRYDVIVTNLPTYNREDMDTQRIVGPDLGYFADEKDGLKFYRRLFKEIPEHLNDQGYLVIECQKRLQEELETLALKSGFELLARTDHAFVFQQNAE